MRVLDATQMREADRYTIDELGIPGCVLMENAGRQVVTAIDARFPALGQQRVAILAGRGNNGGDGFVIARTLFLRDVDVSIFLLGRAADVQGDARLNLDVLGRLGLTVVELASESDWELHLGELEGHSLIVDAMFGTGFRGAASGLLQTIINDINASGIPIVAVDLPSGLSSDTPVVPGDAVKATLTVTLAAPKLPLVLPPGERHCGDLVVAEIGIPQDVIDAVEGPRLDFLSRTYIGVVVDEPREPDAHKGDFGRVVVVAGAVGKAGAAYLAGMAALKSGAGLVTVATPRSAQAQVAAFAPELMTIALDEDDHGQLAASALARILDEPADAIVIGPGLGVGAGVSAVVRGLLAQAGCPLVLDADALNVFAGDTSELRGREDTAVIVTPHPGEMARLVGVSTLDVQADRLGIAREFAIRHGVFVVLKGYRTLIVTPEGAVSINPTGNPGMATAGSGDVLAGMLGAWCAQLLDGEVACDVAVYLHGLAGDLAEADEGPQAMTATDILAHISDAMLDVSAKRKVPPSAEAGT